MLSAWIVMDSELNILQITTVDGEAPKERNKYILIFTFPVWLCQSITHWAM